MFYQYTSTVCYYSIGMSCLRCQKKAKKTISLICDHLLCYPCASLFLELDTLNEREKKYKLKCCHCSKVTYTYDLENLLVIEQTQNSDHLCRESFEEFVAITGRQKFTPKARTRNNSNVEYMGPMITMCQEEEQSERSEKSLLNTSARFTLPKPPSREVLLTRMVEAKKRLDRNYRTASQSITEQFYFLNRILTKHRQTLINDLQFLYQTQAGHLNAHLASLTESSYIASTRLSKMEAALIEIETQQCSLRKLNDERVDNFLKSQLNLVISSPENYERKGKLLIQDKPTAADEGYRSSAPLRSRENERIDSAPPSWKPHQLKFKADKENKPRLREFRQI